MPKTRNRKAIIEHLNTVMQMKKMKGINLYLPKNRLYTDGGAGVIFELLKMLFTLVKQIFQALYYFVKGLKFIYKFIRKLLSKGDSI